MNPLKTLLLTLAIILAGTTSSRAQLLYKVTGNGLEQPSYIFGTHHMAPESICDSIASFRQALESAQAMVGELDMTGSQLEMAMKLQPLMMAPADSTMSQLLPPERFAAMDSSFTALTGVALANFDRMRPMVAQSLAVVAIMSRFLPDFATVLDASLQKQCKEQGKKIIGLETPEFQGHVLYQTLPIPDQISVLEEMLANPEESVCNARQLNAAYMAQDLDALMEISDREQTPREAIFMNALLTERNRNWAKLLPAIFQEGSTFVAVGALHLPGPEGVLALLREQGFDIQPLR